jgi:hypothetical protein
MWTLTGDLLSLASPHAAKRKKAGLETIRLGENAGSRTIAVALA